MVRHIGNRFPVGPVRLFEFPEHGSQTGKGLFMSIHELFQLPDISPIELHQAAPRQSLHNKFKITRTHGQKRQEGQARAEINRHESFVWRCLTVRSLEAIGLALPGGPLVLSSEFMGTHFVKEIHKIVHEPELCAVFRGTEMIRRDIFPLGPLF